MSAVPIARPRVRAWSRHWRARASGRSSSCRRRCSPSICLPAGLGSIRAQSVCRTALSVRAWWRRRTAEAARLEEYIITIRRTAHVFEVCDCKQATLVEHGQVHGVDRWVGIHAGRTRPKLPAEVDWWDRNRTRAVYITITITMMGGRSLAWGSLHCELFLGNSSTSKLV